MLRTPAIAFAVVVVLGGCGRRPSVEEGPRALPVDILADTGRTVSLRVEPPPTPRPEPRASVWLARVSPGRAPIAESPATDPVPETLSVLPSPPPALVVDDGLKPPLPRARPPLAFPAGARGMVELDVRVDEEGGVSEALWAGGTRDPALVRAATECARSMRFFPAQRAGRPVAVWCRQRFDFGIGER